MKGMTALGMAIAALAGAACSGGPSSPSHAPSSAGAAAPSATPAITALAPTLGSASGDTPVVMTGSGFRPGLVVTFDGIAVSARFDPRYSDRVFLATPPHAAGAVDVVATNPNGEAGRLAAGYAYAEPQSFDFNGTWSGFPIDGSDLLVEFTIERNALVRVSCDQTVFALSPPVPIANGAFAFARDGSEMTGKIVSTSQAVGTISLAPCNAPLWIATRKS